MRKSYVAIPGDSRDMHAIFGREALRSVSALGSVPRSVRTRHCACVVFLVVMNLSGIGRAVWTFNRLIFGSLIADLSGAYSALRDLPYWLAVTLWFYSVVIQCYAVAIVGGLARLAHPRATAICDDVSADSAGGLFGVVCCRTGTRQQLGKSRMLLDARHAWHSHFWLLCSTAILS